MSLSTRRISFLIWGCRFLIPVSVALGTGAVYGQTFVTTDDPSSGNPPSPQSLIVPVGTGVINDIDVSFDLFGASNFASEISGITLESPLGTQVLLWKGSNSGGPLSTASLPDGVYTFDDDGPTLTNAILDIGLPDSPVGPANSDGSSLSDFNGEIADGTWNLFGSPSFTSFTIGEFTLIVNNPGRIGEETEILITDVGAINSVNTTGSVMPEMQQQSVQNAAQGTNTDLNNRLFRARSGNPQTQPTSSNDVPISRYFDFMSRNKVGYKFAIGLEDEDRTARAEREVEEHSTLEESNNETERAQLVFSREVPAGDKVVFDDSSFSQWEVFADVDYGFYDQDDLNALARGFRSDSYAATLGIEHQLLPWLYVGAAVSRLHNDTDLTANLGGSELDGTLYSAYFTAFYEQFYLDFLYSYGNYDNETFRNTLTGATALGSTGSDSETVDINIGYVHQLTDQIRTGPIAGFNYTLGHIEGYTERGGGNANLVFGDNDFDSMIARLGWQVTATERTPIGRLTAQLTAQFAHEFRPEGGSTQVSLLNSPFTLVGAGGAQSVGGFGTTVNTPHVGQDWLELGTALRLDLENQWNISLDYSGQYGRNNASAHFVGGRIGYEW